MIRLVTILVVCAPLALARLVHADETPEAAGFIIAYDLKGEDLARGKVVVRKGEELAPTLWMPLFIDDTVFIRSPESTVVLDLERGGRVEIKGERKRFTIEEGGAGTGAWKIITQIAAVFSSEEEEDAPTNLISKGDGSLDVPMAVRGPNFILRDERAVWIAWRGGKGPYHLALDIDDVRHVLGTRAETEIEISIPKTAKSRFALLIHDAFGKRVRVAFQLRKGTPQMPKELAAEAAERGAAAAVLAGWLAAQDNGAWRIEVARILRALPKDDRTAAALLSAISSGWRPHD